MLMVAMPWQEGWLRRQLAFQQQRGWGAALVSVCLSLFQLAPVTTAGSGAAT